MANAGHETNPKNIMNSKYTSIQNREDAIKWGHDAARSSRDSLDLYNTFYKDRLKNKALHKRINDRTKAHNEAIDLLIEAANILYNE